MPSPPLAPPRDCPAGHGTCSCGRCVCEKGWFGPLCQHPRKCNLTEEQSNSLCESADGTLCSGKGEYPPELGRVVCTEQQHCPCSRLLRAVRKPRCPLLRPDFGLEFLPFTRSWKVLSEGKPQIYLYAAFFSHK